MLLILSKTAFEERSGGHLVVIRCTLTQHIYLEEEQLAFVSCKSRVIAMLKGTDWMEDTNTFMIHI